MTKQSNHQISFIGIGAEKSGTTWLFENLSLHPSVFIPPSKELYYFNRYYWHRPTVLNYRYDKAESWYLDFYRNAPPGKISGEICPAYIMDTHAAGKIFAFNPETKIIAMLRHPVERAFSQYLFYIQIGELAPHISFLEAISIDSEILKRGLYFQQLERYYSLFPSKNILVLLFDDLIKDSQKVLSNVFEFLSIPSFFPENTRSSVNTTGTPRIAWLNGLYANGKYFLRKNKMFGVLKIINKLGIAHLAENIRKKNVKPFSERPYLPEETKHELLGYYSEDIKKMEQLLEKDLSAWKK